MSVVDDPTGRIHPAPEPSASQEHAEDPGGLVQVSSAVQRFQACRWRRPPENGMPDCCTHRDVMPLTGAKGFDPEAWCPECGFYKLRRTARKRAFSDEPFWRP